MDGLRLSYQARYWIVQTRNAKFRPRCHGPLSSGSQQLALDVSGLMNPERRLAFLWILEYEGPTFFVRDVFNSGIVSIIKHVKTAMILRGFFCLFLLYFFKVWFL